MALSRTISTIVRTDTLRLLRDQFLLSASAYILGCAIALRWLIPWVQQELLAANGFDISPYVPMGVSYFVLVNASVLTGMVGGFLLLETREERTIQAMRVTPTPLSVHVGTLATAIGIAGAIIPIMVSAALGVGVPSWGAVVVSALLCSPTGVVMALLLSTVAANKVEAFAAMKITAFIGLIPIGGYFLPEPFQYIAGIVPPYWGCKIWWMDAAGADRWGWLILPGVLCSAIWIGVLLRRFQAAVSR